MSNVRIIGCNPFPAGVGVFCVPALFDLVVAVRRLLPDDAIENNRTDSFKILPVFHVAISFCLVALSHTKGRVQEFAEVLQEPAETKQKEKRP